MESFTESCRWWKDSKEETAEWTSEAGPKLCDQYKSRRWRDCGSVTNPPCMIVREVSGLYVNLSGTAIITSLLPSQAICLRRFLCYAKEFLQKVLSSNHICESRKDNLFLLYYKPGKQNTIKMRRLQKAAQVQISFQ